MIISVCIPCYRSSNFLHKVVADIDEEFLKSTEYEYEIILVNDGSPDNTFEIIKEICTRNCHVTGISLSNNFGQQSALLASLPYTHGDVIIFMDDDGQHPATGIPLLVSKINEGYDLVYAKFTHKKHSLFKKLTSKMYSVILEKIGTKPKHLSLSSYCAWSRFAVNTLKEYNSPFPANLAYLYRSSKKITNIEIEHNERIEGQSGYTLGKLISLFLMNFTNFSIIPLHVMSCLGGIMSCLGFLGGIIMILRKLMNPEYILSGYSSTFSLILFSSGLIIITLGLLGEYVGRIYMTVSGMKQYNIREIIYGKTKTYSKDETELK